MIPNILNMFAANIAINQMMLNSIKNDCNYKSPTLITNKETVDNNPELVKSYNDAVMYSYNTKEKYKLSDIIDFNS